MADLTVKYLSGWLHRNQVITTEMWASAWLQKADEADKKNELLVVFSIPNEANGNLNREAVEEIERLLQAKFSPSQHDEPLEISLT